MLKGTEPEGGKKGKEKKKKKKDKKTKRKKSIGGETELVETVNPMMSAEELAKSPQLSEVALRDPSESPAGDVDAIPGEQEEKDRIRSSNKSRLIARLRLSDYEYFS